MFLYSSGGIHLCLPAINIPFFSSLVNLGSFPDVSSQFYWPFPFNFHSLHMEHMECCVLNRIF
uniref:Uncharacterized protein n=1 Tax=Anguilla anguilla TaxID=7936 RepID=A0A0E9QFA1_ANGAN